MGTSADYSAPPNWSTVKSDVTRNGGHAPTPTKARELVRDYISENGGSDRMSSGRGQLGNGKTARNAARSLGGFVSAVARDGLDTALRNNGLQDLIGKSVTETLLGIVSLCGGSEGDIDSVDARNALSKTMDEVCKDARSPEELETTLTDQMHGDKLGGLMIHYFGNYLFEQFCRVFFGQLVQKHGDVKANSFLNSISDVIKSGLANETVNMDLTKVNWFGREGNQMAQTILKNTLVVFE
ncbi:MAG: hypothetical protein CME33_17685 [Gimesia sp.]|uniref:hypothetical protein n=1 Tax=Gimesia sp. TaxID=2024833 RepID=UPI000C6B6E09|nr:hypothetical protein [Gimesia sp.]MAX38389.1 hypothetical protein [Gimesia sp.]|tara:strand:+ start:31166 stop:31885 length:720 start_codon:yes stop_codon:yes gene_type:complete